MIVVDASVAVKWFLPEADSREAASLPTGMRKLFAPELIRIEVAGAITRRVRLDDLLEATAKAACEIWRQALAEGVVALEPTEVDLPCAIELALTLRHPLPDCLYLAVAQRLNASLVTSDQAFAGRAQASHPDVKLLGCLE